ncbi:hypothetical protein EPH95_05925 [Salicibibacter halophilus]|uniref:Uncharacterized protein n=1 Tax=Salicibibacter halophilus TaxID=2502791 RepID=A0A514LFZ0_9BACI|nr:hypothetical protein [Salicibibacter halophilus]QDI90774.1 hypothetical protein EPH95_05925 [Salicibibacter halophilus]
MKNDELIGRLLEVKSLNEITAKIVTKAVEEAGHSVNSTRAQAQKVDRYVERLLQEEGDIKNDN